MTHESGFTSGPDHPDRQAAQPSSPSGQPPAYPPAPPPYGVGPSGAPGHAQPTYGEPYPGQPYAQHPYAGYPGYGPPMRDPNARPGTVTAAAVITFVMTGLVLVLMLFMVVALVVARDSFLEGFQGEAGLTGDPDSWFAGILVVFTGLVGWCVAAIVLGVLAMKRRNWARIALVVSSSMTILFSLVAIASGVSVVTLAAAIAVIVCLFTGGAGDWFHREHLYSPPQMPKI